MYLSSPVAAAPGGYGDKRSPWGLAGVSPQQVAGAATGSAVALAPAIAGAIGLAGAWVPVVGLAIAGIGFAIQAILNSGCGQTCIVASNWANEAGAQLDKNIAAYFAIPAPRPKSVQIAALGNFDAVWNYLYQECSNPALGKAGVNCIADRKAGSCKWKALPPAWPGEPAVGECWNWFLAYRDPIANDPDVYDDSSPLSQVSAGAGQVAGQLLSSVGLQGVNPLWLLLGLGIIAAAVVL